MGTIASLQKQAVQSVPDDPDLIGFLDTDIPEPPTFCLLYTSPSPRD